MGLAIGTGVLLGARAGVIAGIAIPLAGYAALIFWERLDQFLGGARALLLFLVRRRAFEWLRRERQSIRAEILQLADEMAAAEAERPRPQG